MWGEVRGDMVVPHRTNADFQYIYNGDILPENKVVRWNAIYRTINYCNTVLKFAPGVQEVDPSFTGEMLAEFESEALAVRALMNFYLVRTFDEAPLKLTATVSDNENFYEGKNKRSELFAQIVEDLTNAEAAIKNNYGRIEENKGRITRYTINAIQADVYLWLERYDKTIEACNKIINSGQYGLIDGSDPEMWFNIMFVQGNSGESIFELPFSLSKLNPYYNLFKQSKYLKASATAMEVLFPSDPTIEPDSADIRGDRCSFRSGDDYTIWKYVGKSRTVFREPAESFAHFPVYRYAEILLFKAEALAQLGYTDEAIKLVKMIRKRAKASRFSDINDGETDINTVTGFILEERAREFAFEGKRWYDVLRNARRNHYKNLQIMLNMVMMSAPAQKQQTIMNKMRDTLYHYFPVYYTEIEANPNLTQNPFYSK
jgi:tetratricopeptide (TPR) repeat protein